MLISRERLNRKEQRIEELNEETTQADLTYASSEELAALRDRVNEAVSDGSPAVVKSLLQAPSTKLEEKVATPSSPSFAYR